MIDASLRTQAVIVHLHVVIIMSITRNSIAISRIILSTLDLYAFSFKLCSTVKEYLYLHPQFDFCTFGR